MRTYCNWRTLTRDYKRWTRSWKSKYW